MSKAWYIDYATDDWDHCYLVIHCESKSDVKGILKRHMNGKPFKINHVSEWEDHHEKG